MTDRSTRFWQAGFLVVLIWLGAALCHEIDSPWTGYHEFNGACWSQAAHNHLRAGLAQTLGVPAAFYYGTLPIPPGGYYVHHPPAVPLMVTAVFAWFGESERSARLIPIGCSLLTAMLLWWLVRSCVGARAATLSAAAFALLPMELYYGRMVNHEPVALLWMMATLAALRCWHLTGKNRWLAAGFAGFLLGMWTAWPAYIFAAIEAGYFLIASRPPRRRWVGVALAVMALLSAALFVAHIHLVRPNAWADVSRAVRGRAGSVYLGVPFTWGQWWRTQGDYLGHRVGLLAGALAVIGAAYAGRKSAGHASLGWLAGAAGSLFLTNAIYVVGFRSASFEHDYASFYIVAGVAIFAGVALEAMVGWAETAGRARWWPAAGHGLAAVLLGGLAWRGVAGTQELYRLRPYCVVDWHRTEPRDLPASLGRAVWETFPDEGTPLLSNLPDWGSPLEYYARHPFVFNLTTYPHWQPLLDQGAMSGGVIWLGDPGAETLLAALPPGQRRIVDFGGVRFCLWRPG